MHAHLALVHQAALVLVHELDGIFDGDDVVRSVLVDVIDERRQRGALAAAGGARDQHQALAEPAQVHHLGRDAELVGAQDLEGDLAEHRSRSVAIAKVVGAEARDAFDGVGKVRVPLFRQLLPVALGHDGVQELLQRCGVQRRVAFEDGDGTVQAHHGGAAGGEVQVAGTHAHHLAQQHVDGRLPGPRFHLGRRDAAALLLHVRHGRFQLRPPPRGQG